MAAARGATIGDRSDRRGVGAALSIFLWTFGVGCAGGAPPAADSEETRVGLIVGFGPFDGMEENPAAAVARALDAQVLVSPAGRRVRLVGREIPVSYARGVADTVAAAREVGADFVVGVGVDTGRSDVWVEALARGESGFDADVDGAIREVRLGLVPATLHPGRLAAGLGAALSVNAGTYVCNGWLWDTPRALAPIPVGFVHIPRSGIDPDRLAKAVARVADDPRGTGPR